MGKVLAMTFLRYAEAVREPAEFEKEVLPVEVDPKELEWAKTLATALASGDFDLAEYSDKYKQNVRKLIESKVRQGGDRPARRGGADRGAQPH
jgi:non-homologous end joining protein Ku